MPFDANSRYREATPKLKTEMLQYPLESISKEIHTVKALDFPFRPKLAGMHFLVKR